MTPAPLRLAAAFLRDDELAALAPLELDGLELLVFRRRDRLRADLARHAPTALLLPLADDAGQPTAPLVPLARPLVRRIIVWVRAGEQPRGLPHLARAGADPILLAAGGDLLSQLRAELVVPSQPSYDTEALFARLGLALPGERDPLRLAIEHTSPAATRRLGAPRLANLLGCSHRTLNRTLARRGLPTGARLCALASLVHLAAALEQGTHSPRLEDRQLRRAVARLTGRSWPEFLRAEAEVRWEWLREVVGGNERGNE